MRPELSNRYPQETRHALRVLSGWDCDVAFPIAYRVTVYPYGSGELSLFNSQDQSMEGEPVLTKDRRHKDHS